MLLTISTTGDEPGRGGGPPATDLGFVLHKHPDNVRTISTTAGRAMVFWPEAATDRATMATLVDVDPIGLVRRGRAQPLAAYVNDRPYVASSFLSVALGRLFRSAMNGDCPSRPDLVEHRWSVTVRVPAVPVGGDRRIIDHLFSPLGYRAHLEVPLLDDAFPAWGSAGVGNLTLQGRATMRDLLRHLYVLLPVLDDDKHYWIDESEVNKLLRHGDGWLADHPEQKMITRRYLGHYRHLTSLAFGELTADEPTPDGGPGGDVPGDTGDGTGPASEEQVGDVQGNDEQGQVDQRLADADEAVIEKPLSLNAQRMAAVVAAVTATGASSVVDLGCGEGALLLRLADERSLDRLVGVDVAMTALRRAETRLGLNRRPERKRPTIELRHSALTYRDPDLAGFDVACLIEVIEHLDEDRVDAMAQILFQHNRPGTVIVTTPNREYNSLFNMADGALRHRDHRFEWTRAEFGHWCEEVAGRYHYRVERRPIGPEDPDLGPPTQMAVLTRIENP